MLAAVYALCGFLRSQLCAVLVVLLLSSGCAETVPDEAGVFVRSGSTWTEEASFCALNGAASDQLGDAVAISEDGSRASWSSRDDTAGADSGGARVFRRNGTTWVKEASLAPSSPAAGDFFADGVAVDASGTRALVASGTACADGSVCTVTDTCNAEGACVPGIALQCDDGNECTDDSCDAQSGVNSDVSTPRAATTATAGTPGTNA